MGGQEMAQTLHRQVSCSVAPPVLKRGKESTVILKGMHMLELSLPIVKYSQATIPSVSIICLAVFIVWLSV